MKISKSLKRLNYIFISLIASLSLTNCIIEIPLKIAEVKNVPKYREIPLKSDDSTNNDTSPIPLDYIKIFNEEGKIIINNYFAFITPFKIGSNNQVFNLLIDTGSDKLWIPRKGYANESIFKNQFDPYSSSTCYSAGEPFEVEYGKGYAIGDYYFDYVTCINNYLLKLKFGVAKNIDFDGGKIVDGVVGLARNYEDDRISLINMLYREKIISSKAFSFKFYSIYENGKGSFFIGKHEDFSKPETTSCNLLNDNYNQKRLWYCEMSGMSLELNEVTIKANGNHPVLFDTGTNSIIMPLDYKEEIEKHISGFGCSFIKNPKRKFEISYAIKCKKGDSPDFIFKIGSSTYKIPNKISYEEYDKEYEYSLVCFKNSTHYILGVYFFWAYHTMFSQEDNKLYFYEEDVDNLGYGSSTFATIITIISLVILIAVLICCIFRCIIKC